MDGSHVRAKKVGAATGPSPVDRRKTGSKHHLICDGTGTPLPVITRVADRQWHALDDDLVVGRGYVEHRPDGRLFVSIDAWHDATFDRLAEAVPPPSDVTIVPVGQADERLLRAVDRAIRDPGAGGAHAVRPDARPDRVPVPELAAVGTFGGS